jgi:hypothetical protein
MMPLVIASIISKFSCLIDFVCVEYLRTVAFVKSLNSYLTGTSFKVMLNFLHIFGPLLS